MKLNKKILLPLSTLALVATPIAVVVSCSKENTAEENEKKDILASGDSLLMKQYLSKVNETEFGKANYTTKKENAWKFWASRKLMDSQSFWIDARDDLIQSGLFQPSDFFGEWHNGMDDSKVTVDATNGIQRGTYPSWTIAKKILSKQPTLTWDTELDKMLMVERYLTSMTAADYGKMFKKEKDQPANFQKPDGKNGGENFYLIKYLKENTPTFVWKQEVKGDKHFAVVKDVLTDASSFNGLDASSFSLLKSKLVKQNQLKTSEANKLTINVGDLYNYQGIGSTGLSKGDLDYSEKGLRKRIKTNTSESGWVNKDGDIEGANTKVIVETGVVKAMYVMQFLPWFDAKDDKGAKITDVKNIAKADDKKSFWRLDEALTKDKANMEKLIFTFALSDSGLFDAAKKFMLQAREYNLDTNNQTLKDKLKEEGIVQ